MGENTGKNLELYDLSTVAVAVFSDAPEAILQRKEIIAAGAESISDTSPEGLQTITRQKIAVIFDEKTSAETLQEQVKIFEDFISEHPEASVRFFFLYWTQDENNERNTTEVFNTGERFDRVNIKDIATARIPRRVNETLYKARLPFFLREGYEVEIKPSLESIDGTEYRPIVIRGYKPSEIETAYDYSEYDYIDGTHNGGWVLRVTDDGDLEKIDTPPGSAMSKKYLTIGHATGVFSFYSQKHRKLYRLEENGNLVSTPLNEAHPGILEYVTDGLYIHNKKLFQKENNGVLKEIKNEKDLISAKRTGSKIYGTIELEKLKSSSAKSV